MEREEVIVQHQRDVSDIALSKKNKGKTRARDLSIDEDAVHEKYREAVKEKKGSFFPFFDYLLFQYLIIFIRQRWSP